MKPYYKDDAVTLYNGDCRDVIASLSAESLSSVVTDPPYGLAFMGKRWDYDVPAVEVWQGCLRVLKPGGHLLAFAGTRTQHRMAVRIEDAGFEIRDMIAWVYGSGFPKSLDVSKAIDKAAGAEREVVGISSVTGARQSRTMDDGNKGTRRTYQNDEPVVNNITAPATDAARQWAGWGTALKPAIEPITVARKPLIGTVAENVLAHGTGAINVDGCRVGIDASVDDPRLGGAGQWKTDKAAQNVYKGGYEGKDIASSPLGRWPANLIHDGSDEINACFPAQAGGGFGGRGRGGSTYANGEGFANTLSETGQTVGYGDSGSAARFFYCAKASDREILAAEELPLFGESFDAVKNNHPTVKPVALMRWLIRLVTPPSGVLLDPFAGSGTTGVAAKLEGRKATLIELDERYCEIAAKRLEQQVFEFGD
jgi:site-specific DNA-methyltransferase (adenine-specific)